MRKAKFARYPEIGDSIVSKGVKREIGEVLSCDFYLDWSYLNGFQDIDTSYINLKYMDLLGNQRCWSSTEDGGTIEYKELVKLNTILFEETQFLLSDLSKKAKGFIEGTGSDFLIINIVGENMLCSLGSEKNGLHSIDLPILRYNLDACEFSYNKGVNKEISMDVQTYIINLLGAFNGPKYKFALDVIKVYSPLGFDYTGTINLVVSDGQCSLVAGVLSR